MKGELGVSGYQSLVKYLLKMVGACARGAMVVCPKYKGNTEYSIIMILWNVFIDCTLSNVVLERNVVLFPYASTSLILLHD